MPPTSAALSPAELALLKRSRRGVLATVAPDGRPRLVPIAYAVAPWTDAQGRVLLYSALDEKPKSVADPRLLARVRDIEARPRVSVLFDEWHEDWSRLAWLRLEGMATLLEPTSDGRASAEHAQALRSLRERYPQYRDQRLEQRPILRIKVERIVGWSAAS